MKKAREVAYFFNGPGRHTHLVPFEDCTPLEAIEAKDYFVTEVSQEDWQEIVSTAKSMGYLEHLVSKKISKPIPPGEREGLKPIGFWDNREMYAHTISLIGNELFLRTGIQNGYEISLIRKGRMDSEKKTDETMQEYVDRTYFSVVPMPAE